MAEPHGDDTPQQQPDLESAEPAAESVTPPLSLPAPGTYPSQATVPEPSADRPRFVSSPPRRRSLLMFFFGGVLTFLLGSVILLVTGYFWWQDFQDQVFQTQPMAIQPVRYEKKEGARIQQRFENYGNAVFRGRDPEIIYNEREFGIFSDVWLRVLKYEQYCDKFRLKFYGNQTELQLTLPSHELEGVLPINVPDRWVNIIVKGQIYIRDGRLALVVRAASLGEWEVPEAVLGWLSERIIDYLHHDPAYHEVLSLVETAYVVEGKLHLRVNPEEFGRLVHYWKDRGKL